MSSDVRAVPPDYSGSLLLVRAMSEAEAETEARRFALTEEDDYENSDGERVTWTFVDVLDVRLVSTRLRDGSEVYSWLMNEDVFSRVRSAF